MTATAYRNPWDEDVLSGYDWTDRLTSTWGGQTVQVVRNLSPATPEFVRIEFPDRSVLYLGVDALPALDLERHETEVVAAQAAEATDAARAWGAAGWMRQLYEDATAKDLGTDEALFVASSDFDVDDDDLPF
jgi:hypothetical protein